MKKVEFKLFLLKRIFLGIFLILILAIIVFTSHKIYREFNLLMTQIVHFENLYNQQIMNNQTSDFDIVLNYYAENITYVAQFIQFLRNSSTLQKLKYRIILYNKNSKVNNRYLQSVLKADFILQRPNVGREGETYLHHIINNYDRLATHIFFCQASVEGMTKNGFDDWFSNRLEKQFNTSVGYMPMVNKRWMAVHHCAQGPYGENRPHLAQLWALIQQTLCPPGGQAVFYRGQFLVSAKRIRIRPIRIYQYIKELLSVDETHWIHGNKPSQKFRSRPDNPEFGHVVERLWTTLFNCTNPNIIHRCRENECACYD